MTLNGLTMLVVEDEPIIAIALEDLLLDAGACPVVVSSIASAQRVLAAKAIDGALLDVNLGHEKSYPIAEILADRGIPFIFATGYGDALHAAEFTTVPTIAKPYSLTEIERAFGDACCRRTVRG